MPVATGDESGPIVAQPVKTPVTVTRNRHADNVRSVFMVLLC